MWVSASRPLIAVGAIVLAACGGAEQVPSSTMEGGATSSSEPMIKEIVMMRGRESQTVDGGDDRAPSERAFSVLLATDGQPAAGAAEQLLQRVADPGRVAITVLGVSSYELALSEGVRTEGRYSPQAALRHVEDSVGAAVARFTAVGFATEAAIEHDDATLRILEAATDRGSGLIVVGGRRWSLPGPAAALDRLADEPAYMPPEEAAPGDTATVLDSVSTRVVHRAGVPVMVVHGEPLAAPDEARVRVVVGADGSPASAAAVRAFAGLADPSSVEVIVVGVVEPDPNLSVARTPSGEPMIAVGSRTGVVDEETARSVVDRSHHGVETVAVSTADELGGLGFATRVEIIEGSADSVLLDQVRAAGASLAVGGSRGLGMVRRALLGSVSETLVHAAPATLIAHARDTDSDHAS